MKNCIVLTLTCCGSLFAGITTTPEPASIGLMAVGVGALGYFGWRKSRKK